MGGPTVNQPAVQQEQQNQQQAQQYAAQQQQAAQAAVAAWNKANPAPGTNAAPLQQPNASAPATMGGGNFAAQSQPVPGSAPPGGGQMRSPAGPQPGGMPQLPPQILAAIQQQMATQGRRSQ